jgi:hypothetical protein
MQQRARLEQTRPPHGTLSKGKNKNKKNKNKKQKPNMLVGRKKRTIMVDICMHVFLCQNSHNVKKCYNLWALHDSQRERERKRKRKRKRKKGKGKEKEKREKALVSSPRRVKNKKEGRSNEKDR